MNEKEITEVLKEAKEAGIFKDLYCRTIRMVGEEGSSIIISTEKGNSTPLIAMQNSNAMIQISLRSDGAYLALGSKEDPKVMLRIANDTGEIILFDNDGNRRDI